MMQMHHFVTGSSKADQAQLGRQHGNRGAGDQEAGDCSLAVLQVAMPEGESGRLTGRARSDLYRQVQVGAVSRRRHGGRKNAERGSPNARWASQFRGMTGSQAYESMHVTNTRITQGDPACDVARIHGTGDPSRPVRSKTTPLDPLARVRVPCAGQRFHGRPHPFSSVHQA